MAGATGVVGRRLCRLLIGDGWTVAGTTRSSEKAGMLRDMGIEPVVVDVYDGELLRTTMMAFGPSVVVHQLTDLPYGLDLRYGRLYGPGTGFDLPPETCPLHVDAAADAARRAINARISGIYNVAENVGSIDSSKIRSVLNWSDAFRMNDVDSS